MLVLLLVRLLLLLLSAGATFKNMMMLIMLNYHATTVQVCPICGATVKTFNFLVPLMSSNNCYEILTVDLVFAELYLFHFLHVRKSTSAKK